MASRMMSDLEPSLAKKAYQFLEKCREAGLPVHITCTGRTEREQAALYAQGRKPLAEVNEMRKACGLWMLKDEDNRRPITWTMQSKHIIRLDAATGMALNHARAFDVALVRDKQMVWELKVDINDNDIPDWEEIGRLGEACGLVWGGRWKSPDRPHFEEA